MDVVTVMVGTVADPVLQEAGEAQGPCQQGGAPVGGGADRLPDCRAAID